MYRDPSGYVTELSARAKYDQIVLNIGRSLLEAARLLVKYNNVLSLTLSALITSELSIMFREADFNSAGVTEKVLEITWEWPQKRSEEKSKTNAITLTNDNQTNGHIYYHATSSEKAAEIRATNMIKGSKFEGYYVFAWKAKPDKKALKYSGAYSCEVLITFKTDVPFEPDYGITDKNLQNIFR